MTTRTQDRPSQQATDPARPTTPRWLVPAGLGTALVALTGGLLLGRGLDRGGVETVDDPVSIGFAQDMPGHHAQAVEMAAVVHRRTQDPELARMAFDIMTTQQGQIGIMTGWLDLWQPAGTDREPMAWMGEEHAGHMPGMATREQVASLETLPVPQMEERFLRLMIHHHRGALPMADYAADHAESPEVASLARGMDRGQAAEIELMQDMLRARGWAPEPEDPMPMSGGAHGGHGG